MFSKAYLKSIVMALVVLCELCQVQLTQPYLPCETDVSRIDRAKQSRDL